MNAERAHAVLAELPVWDDIELLHQVDGDRELAGELIEIFLEDEPQMRADLRAAFAAGAADRLASAAHAYKGSAAAIGAQQVSVAAADLETIGRAGRRPAVAEVETFEQLAGSLIEELERALSVD